MISVGMNLLMLYDEYEREQVPALTVWLAWAYEAHTGLGPSTRNVLLRTFVKIGFRLQRGSWSKRFYF